MSALINKNTCKYVVIDVGMYEKVLEFVQRSGGGSFPDFEYEARPVLGELVVTPDYMPWETEDGLIEILSDNREDLGTRNGTSLLSQAIQAILSYPDSLC